MRARHAKLLIVFLSAAALTLTACSDDSGTGGANNGGANNGGANNGGDNNGGTNNGGGDAGGDATGANNGGGDAGGDGGGGNNGGVCQPTTNFVEVYQPNVYLLIDRSSSMEGEPMTQAKAGLDTVATELADQIRFGVGAYPFPSAGCNVNDLLSVGANTVADMQSAWSGLTPAGGTPTGSAIFQVRDRELITDDADANDAKRDKALVLITDGEPTVCEEEHPAVQEAREMAQTAGVPVYVVGFRSDANPATLEDLAQAGGTDAPGANAYYTADDTASLADAIRDISGNVIGCTQQLSPAPESADLINVEIDEQSVPRDSADGFSYDAASGTLSINGSWCDQLQNAASDGTILKVTIFCPGCTTAGQSCTADGECCSGTCQDGTCTTLCQPLGGTCQDDGDCCGDGACADRQGLTGTCISG